MEKHRAQQAATFDAIGGRYDEAFPHKEGQIAAADRSSARLRPGARVLDVGCGTGVPAARQLTEAGCEVTGIDISARMLELARRNVPQARFLQRDVLDVDPSMGRFDAAMAFFTLLMLPRAEIPPALRRLRAVLAPGGLLTLGMVEAELDDVSIPFLGWPLRVTAYSRGQLREVVEAEGFRVEDEDARSYAPASPDAEPEVQLFLDCRLLP